MSDTEKKALNEQEAEKLSPEEMKLIAGGKGGPEWKHGGPEWKKGGGGPEWQTKNPIA